MGIFQAARSGTVDDVQQAIAAGGDVNARDEYGQTPLMYAAGANSGEVLQALISAGADIHAETPAKWNASHYAARDNINPEAIMTLIDAGIDMTLETQDDALASELAREANRGGPHR